MHVHVHVLTGVMTLDKGRDNDEKDLNFNQIFSKSVSYKNTLNIYYHYYYHFTIIDSVGFVSLTVFL